MKNFNTNEIKGIELTAEEVAILEAAQPQDDGIDYGSCFIENNDLPF